MISFEGETVFPAVLSELHSMLDLIKRAGKQSKFPQEKLLKLELACEELLVNIISYAYQGENSPGIIKIACKARQDDLEVVIKDHGPSFNPLTVRVNIQEDLPLEQRKLGGLGIFLAKSSVDEFLYTRENDCNIVHLKIHNNASY
ncbi:Serine-protein kinase rsbW,serine-protein kinase RsbW,anti-sigma B factor [Chlamydia serpentis]|uniref:Serine-protein kinase rsbW,serine-protein kinase RsbW,anti-sigma B factor n=1 Tax=Chlamydia serpentis TaxID=1967782 RepID=A0A2R8FBI3_9CHLA|nr:anti-sigma regulatory factor [Chlamydia serpentis]SPN73789.1 Serine-protein kinase rsbW,serine-protein kinase RsbW,anti-sigma B factor [Chlamydia serpentis]